MVLIVVSLDSFRVPASENSLNKDSKIPITKLNFDMLETCPKGAETRSVEKRW